MIRDNDRVLVCLSPTGRDSLALLHTLHQYRSYVRSKGVEFELGAATVDTNKYDPLELMSYLKALDVPYFYEEQTAEAKCNSGESQPEELDVNGACSFCNRATRAQLYDIAKRHNYNVLALGQHLDDLTEGFLVSVFHGGKLKTMKAHYYIRRQDLRVVRPFVYVREKSLRQFVESKKLLASRETRSSDLPEKQKQSKELILQQERAYPRLYSSLKAALRPLIDAHGHLQDSDSVPLPGNSPGNNSNGSSCSSSSTSSGSTGTGNQQQKRQRRAKTSSVIVQCPSQEQEDEDETDEEPVL